MLLILLLFLNINPIEFEDSQDPLKYHVVIPENYDQTKEYPLFIVLHGGNGNMREMQKKWNSSKLEKDYITIYMEASTRDSPGDHWGWRDIPAERQNISNYYQAVMEQYQVDTSRVYAGGLFLGAKMSVDLVMTQTIPVKGIISICHGGGLTSTCNFENLEDARKRKAHIIVIDGEKDYTYRGQSEDLQAILEESGIRYKYVRNPGMGHTIPNDFDVQLDGLLDLFN